MTHHILVVDDDPDVRGVFAACLEDCGYRITEAADGRAGLEQFRRDRPDLVLCDLRMPVLDGMAMLSRLAHEAPEVPVVVVSGARDLTLAVEALKLGAYDYITKPVLDLTVLEHAVLKAIERAELARQNRAYREHLEQTNRELRESLARLREDEEAGRRIQFQLLPPPRQVFGDIECAHALLPSTALSGDFVDYFAIDEEQVGLYVADVSGHGVPSALVTVLVKSFFAQCLAGFHRHGEMAICRPARMLQRLNDYLLGQRLPQHVTIFYAVIDRRANKLLYCNGGQFPHPMLRDGSEPVKLSQHGPAVGLFEFATFEECEIDLPREFTLVALSDGVLEVLDEPSVEAKEARLLPLLARGPRTVEELRAELQLFEGRELPDDVALLVATRSAR